MPENNASPFTLTPVHLTACLTGLVHGPYGDADTAAVAGLTAETIRYLNYAVPRGGVTDPATVYAVSGDLTAAAYRLPQLLAALGDWLAAEAAAGRLADDHRRPAAGLADRISAAIRTASDQAGSLAAGLSAVHNLAATLHADPAPAA
jgi:hypothetical protein